MTSRRGFLGLFVAAPVAAAVRAVLPAAPPVRKLVSMVGLARKWQDGYNRCINCRDQWPKIGDTINVRRPERFRGRA